MEQEAMRQEMTGEEITEPEAKEPKPETQDRIKEERKEAKKIFSRLGLAYFLFLAVTFVFQMGMIILAKITGNQGIFASENVKIILSMLSMYGAGFPLFWLMVKGMPVGYGDSACEEKWEKEKWGFVSLFICFLIAIGVMEAGNLIGNQLMNAVNESFGTDRVNDVFTMIMESNLVIIVAFAVLLAPLMEELMFRKILIDRIIRYGEVRAMIVSGILFGIVHGNFYQFFYACGLGMIFAYVYIRTGKLRFTVIMHMMINGMSAIIAGGLLKTLEYERFMAVAEAGDVAGIMEVLGNHWLSYVLLILYSLGLLAAAFIGIVLFICVLAQKKIHFFPAVQKIPGRFTYAPVFLNVGMALFLAACVVEFMM